MLDTIRTVSQVRHRVSLVSTPSKSLCTRVASSGAVPAFELVAVTIVAPAFDDRVIIELDTMDNYNERVISRDYSHRNKDEKEGGSQSSPLACPFCAARLCSSTSSTILLSR